jgi:hypothetical protein
MITLRLTGGLGNQMFQYAAGLALARRRGTGVRLDLHFYRSGGDGGVYKRPFELPLFELEPFEVSRGVVSLWDRARSRAAERVRSVARPLAVHVERGAGFDPAVLALADGTMLVGYFQSESYFADDRAAVQAAFRLRDGDLADTMRARVAALRRGERPLVSVHVRRGDYLAVRPDGGMLVPLERLCGAIAGFPGADFLVFSDDLPWCAEHLGGEGVTLSPFGSAIEDLAAMSLCDHHIIANSSFSWWGAWLNPSSSKQVFAPGDWYGAGAAAADVYAPGWRKY